MDTQDIAQLLQDWQFTKDKIAQLEKIADRCKTQVAKIMTRQNINKLSAGKFSVLKRHNNRTSISKKDVPPDTWAKYSNKSSYDSYTLQYRKK